jgi:Protein of unknown function (DUF3025)
MNVAPEVSGPWLLPYLPLAHQVLHAAKSQPVADALNAQCGGNPGVVRFLDHAALPPGEPYESFIARTGSVPTRDNLHDLFNGVMWLTWPLTKQRLNFLHAQMIARQGSTGPRGTLRDVLTVFDENAALLQASPALVDALRARDWKTAFIEQRAMWQCARLVVFGHALMEKLMQPRKAITAHVWIVTALTDEALAASLTVDRLMSKPFLPLPVLGVPGWWPANEAEGFYDDAEVFRPLR